MVKYMFQCYFLESSHIHLLPLSPKVCSLYLYLLCCPTCRIVGTIFLNSIYICNIGGFLCSSVSKESAYDTGGPGSISRLGRSSKEGNGNPLQYSCLEKPMDRVVCQATVHGVARVRHDLATKPPHTVVTIKWSGI